MPDQHAKFSPSSAHRWVHCPGSIAKEAGYPDVSSIHADEGTAAHELAAKCLDVGLDAWQLKHNVIEVGEREFTVDDEMAEHVQKYVDAIRDYSEGNARLVEQRVEFGDVIGVPDQFGTADAIILADSAAELQIHDLKYGRGKKVYAEDNEQLMLYALGALNTFGPLGDWERVRLVIHQPRLDHLSEWDCPIDWLDGFAEEAKQAAALAQTPEAPIVPGTKQCNWCKAKADCRGAAEHAAEAVLVDFETLQADTAEVSVQPVGALTEVQVARIVDNLDYFEGWAKAVRQRAHDLAMADSLPGFKCVAGRRGPRSWSSDFTAEQVMRSMRLKREEMYTFKLASPTQAEKLLKKESPRRWAKLESLVHQPQGKPTLVPESDPRPAVTNAASAGEFETVED